MKMNSFFKRLMKELLNYRGLLVICIAAAVGGAFLDTLTPRISQWAIDNIIRKNDNTYLKEFIIFFIIFIVLQVLSVYVFITYVGKLEVKFSRNLRERVFKKVQRLGMNYFNKNDDGWIIARLTSDVSKISEVISWQIVDAFYFLILIVFSMLSIFIYSYKAGIAIIIIYPILLFLIRLIKEKILKQYRNVRAQNSALVSRFNELINGNMTVKTMSIEEKGYKDFELDNYKLRRASRHVYLLQALFVPILITVGYLMVSFTFKFTVEEYLFNGMTVGAISATLTYSLLLVEVTGDFTGIISELQHAQANAERVYGLLDETEAIIDDEEIIDKYGDRFSDVKIAEELKGDIEFKNVYFDYENGESLFNNLNLKIKSGESVALVGPTGSGKTTIINLLSRFYSQVSGDILIDGKPITKRSVNWLHNQIGHVLQHPFLFKGSIKENIKYNHDVSDDRVLEVCGQLQLNSVINRLEHGLDTQVGEGGSKLSVGEKQLISFARALIHDPKIIILDEATSSIDSESEMLIQAAMNTIMKNRTTIIVAHRLSTIEKCDKIVYIKKGEIIEEGSHRELMDKKGAYYEMHSSVLK